MKTYSFSPGEERILISCAGVGMGNASRVIAVVEALHDQAAKNNQTIFFHIVTWGSALTFLSEYQKQSSLEFELIPAHAYRARGRFRPLDWLIAFTRNVMLLRRAVRSICPSLIVLDSDYHFPAFLGAGCPLVYLGQAHDVIERSKRNDYRPATLRERLHFTIGEKLDAALQNIFSDRILVPSFLAGTNSNPKIDNIPLIVRKEFLDAGHIVGHSVGILLSGSELEKNAFLTVAEKYGLFVMTPGLAAEKSTVPTHAASLDRCDIIFTQGGLSSISEAIARGKFLVVFPLRDHPEQQLNAIAVEELGLGMRASLEDLQHFPDLLEKIAMQRRQGIRSHTRCNGALAAAGIILKTISQSREIKAERHTDRRAVLE